MRWEFDEKTASQELANENKKEKFLVFVAKVIFFIFLTLFIFFATYLFW